MKDYPYFKAYIAEILIDTMGMSEGQKGDYLDGLIIAWKTMNPEKMPQWMQEYADDTIKKSAKLSENSKVRWANGMQLHSKSNAKAMQIPYKRGEDRIGEDRRIPPISPKGGDAIGFDDFWDAYPRKVKKPEARKAFQKAIKKTTLGTMLNAIEAQKQTDQWSRDEEKFIPHPTSWLNQERWADVTEKPEDTNSFAYIEKQLNKEFGIPQQNISGLLR